jgi:hypothetical protein
MTRTIRCIYVVLTVCQCLLLLAAIEKPAYGYVDPGSGILLVQVLSSALGGVVFFLRKRIRYYFQQTKKVLSLNQSGRPDEMQP